MDTDTSKAFDKLGGKIDTMHETLVSHVAFDKGLNLPTRMKEAEEAIEKKPSWPALVTAIFVACVLIGAAIGIAKGLG